jgi:hypothetical protein
LLSPVGAIGNQEAQPIAVRDDHSAANPARTARSSKVCEASKLDQKVFQDVDVAGTIPARDRESCAADCKLRLDENYIVF